MKLKLPLISSVAIFSIYLVLLNFHFNANDLAIDCFRKVDRLHHWKVYLPIQLILSIAAIAILVKIRAEIKERVLDLLLITPILFSLARLIFNMIRNAAIWVG